MSNSQKYEVYKEEYNYSVREHRVAVAAGLQAVDGLAVTDTFYDLADGYIAGKYDEVDFSAQVKQYYEQKRSHDASLRDAEADIVSANITKVLAENGFSFYPRTLQGIHKRIFECVDTYSKKYLFGFRDYNVTKSEPILAGRTVSYENHTTIKEALEYDFKEYSLDSFVGLAGSDFVDHVAEFTSRIWQIHPFVDGNTRTVAVFLQQLLGSFGYTQLSNELFEKKSLEFRNALVRANFSDIQAGIPEEPKYLREYISAILGMGDFEYRNRDMVCLELFGEDDGIPQIH